MYQIWSKLSLCFVIQHLWSQDRDFQQSQCHVFVRRLSPSIKTSVVVTWHGSAVFPCYSTRPGMARHPFSHISFPSKGLSGLLERRSDNFLAECVNPISKETGLQLHVHGVWKHPPDKAEKNNDQARVNEEITIEAAAQTQITKNSEQKHEQTGRVKHNSEEEERSAFTQADVAHIWQQTDTSRDFHLFDWMHISHGSICASRLTCDNAPPPSPPCHCDQLGYSKDWERDDAFECPA